MQLHDASSAFLKAAAGADPTRREAFLDWAGALDQVVQVGIAEGIEYAPVRVMTGWAN